jgi:hypothetical protein
MAGADVSDGALHKAGDIAHRCGKGCPSKCATASNALRTMPWWAHRLDTRSRVSTSSSERNRLSPPPATTRALADADLSRLVEAPGVSTLLYVDPAFPNRPLVLHAARPRDYDVATSVLFVHHGVGRNGRDYRD